MSTEEKEDREKKYIYDRVTTTLFIKMTNLYIYLLKSHKVDAVVQYQRIQWITALSTCFINW